MTAQGAGSRQSCGGQLDYGRKGAAGARSVRRARAEDGGVSPRPQGPPSLLARKRLNWRAPPCPHARRREAAPLTAEEVEGLAAAHPERYRAMVLVAAYGGFRFGELAGLRRRRIDLAGNVRVEETCVEVAGDLVWGAPKTEAGRRSVALPSFVVRALREHERQ
ncbi:MAG: hypothetical protein ACRDZ4_23775 [Egibacteraceae bacterium]